jgi:hypothetical protein
VGIGKKTGADFSYTSVAYFGIRVHLMPKVPFSALRCGIQDRHAQAERPMVWITRIAVNFTLNDVNR